MSYDKSKVIVALDNYSVPMAEEIIARWSPEVWGFKLNHNLYPYIGRNYNNIFCDYKLYDIPNTMCSIIERLIDDGCEMVTLHMTNNKRAIEAVSKYKDDIKLLGVTVLTSWDFADIQKVLNSGIDTAFMRSINLMEEYGFYGMICSPQDLQLHKGLQTGLKKICPGIRNNPGNDDQVRTATPEQAFAAGADYIVMGRSFFENA